MKNPIVSEIQNFGRFTQVVGIILFLLGSVGIALPVVMSMTASIFIGWLMLLAGLSWLYYTYQHSYKHLLDWIKPILLVAVALLILVDPLAGVIAFTLLFSIYLLLDASGSFFMAYSMHPKRYSQMWCSESG